jgi:hypothetical protein
MDKEPKPLSKFEKLKFQEERALEEYNRLLKDSEDNPSDLSLKAGIGPAFGEVIRIRREIDQLLLDKLHG